MTSQIEYKMFKDLDIKEGDTVLINGGYKLKIISIEGEDVYYKDMIGNDLRGKLKHISLANFKYNLDDFGGASIVKE